MKTTRILELINKEYRESRQIQSKMSKQIDEIIYKQNDENISHKEYIKLNEDFAYMSKELAELDSYNNGLCSAREILLSVLYEDEVTP